MKIPRILLVLVASTIFLSGCSSQRETWKIIYTASPSAINAAMNSDG
jgi:uncharacterized lipoprotein YajG